MKNQAILYNWKLNVFSPFFNPFNYSEVNGINYF